MKKIHYVAFAISFVFLSGLAFAQYDVPTNYSTIQAAVNAAPATSTIHIAAATYSEAVTVNKQLTLIGVGPTTVITPPSGPGITVTSNGVTIQSLKVTGATSASGILAVNVDNLTLTSVEADNNGTGTTGSGIDLVNVGGTTVVTGAVATGNARHGLAIGNGSTGVSVSGGTFTGNGQSGDPNTGAGIIVYADAGKSTSNVSISGNVTSNTNKTAGIEVSCEPTGTLSGTTIGATGTVTLNDNGSTSGTYGTGGAAVLVYGACSGTTITATSTNSGAVNPSAGLVVLGTDATGSNSPTGTVVKNSTLTGFNLTSPAGTMKATGGAQTLICTSDVDATVGNSIVGFSTGFQVEDALFHKVDSLALGLFKGPGTVLFVTPNSGSIQRAVTIAPTYSANEVDVEDGTYAENVVVGSALLLKGQGANTIVKPSSGAPVAAGVAGVTFENLHLYLNGAFAPSNTPTFTNNTFTFRTQAKVFLQGPYSGGAMNTTLLTNSLIPLSQPYNVSPFNYPGTETVASIPANVVDWILVELRSGTAGTTKTSVRAAFLKNDGTVLETDGSAGVWETDTVASGYSLAGYVVIRHRNHLATMSAATVSLPNGSTYDFTADSTMAYGFATAEPMVNVSGLPTGSGGIYAMWAGDVTGNGQIKYAGSGNDRGPIYTRIGGTTFTATANGYYPEDCNLNGQVKYAGSGNDRGIIYSNIGGSSFTATRSTAVPN